MNETRLNALLALVEGKDDSFQLLAIKNYAANNKARAVYVQPSQMALFQEGIVPTITVSDTQVFPFTQAWELAR